MWLYPQNSSSSEEKSQAPPQVAREVLRRSRLWKHLAKSCQWQEDQRPLLIQYLFNKYTESSFKLRAEFSKPERRLNRSPESKWSRESGIRPWDANSQRTKEPWEGSLPRIELCSPWHTVKPVEQVCEKETEKGISQRVFWTGTTNQDVFQR